MATAPFVSARALALSCFALLVAVIPSAQAQETAAWSAVPGISVPQQSGLTSRKLQQATCAAQCAASPKQPVCGKDKKTYGNYCLAACAKATVAYWGACNPKPCLCPPLFAPVCAAGKSYYSPCFAACAGAKGGSANLCPGDCKCPSTKAIVTGIDGKQYDNVCYATCAGTEVAYSGTPDARLGTCKCPPTYSPVCEKTFITYPSAYPGLPDTKIATNITHLNPCIATCKGAVAGTTKPGVCGDYLSYDSKAYLCGCPVVFDPVCARIPILNTTVTMPSKCAATCSGFNVTTPGICPGCICPATAKPVCAGKKTYKTACAARCEGGATTWTQGACTPCNKCPPPTGLDSYVCSTKNIPYPTACNAECLGETIAYKGMCKYTTGRRME